MLTQLTSPKMIRKSYGYITLFLIFISSSSLALEDDTKQPIHIKAEKSQFDNANGFLSYQGNVELIQGSIEIRAEIIDLTIVNDSITFVEASGFPATFQQDTNLEGDQVKAVGNTIRYLVSDGKLEIYEQAELHQGSNKMSGGEIFYDLVLNLANITGDPEQGDGRMEMIFKPAGAEQ